MSVLEIDDQLIDRAKSGFYLYYLARAANKQNQRELMRRKVELSVKQLKKLNTEKLGKNVKEIDSHIEEAVMRERQIQTHQKGEELVHTELKHKITSLEHKLGRYLETQETRKKRIEQIEQKIKHKFATKKEKTAVLRADVQRLIKLYRSIKKERKHAPEELLRVGKRILRLKERIATLR